MILNIETNNPEATLEIVRKVYSQAKLTEKYAATADYTISDEKNLGNEVYSLEGLMELQYHGIPFHKIRIW